MNTAVAERPEMGAIIEDVIAKGDLNKLTAEQRVVHYHNVCRSIGLNPLTQPLQYITLQGKLVLYARKDACDQLRRINGISVEVVAYEVVEGLLTVRVRATDKNGRSDEDFGVVPVAGLRGEAAANAFLKAVTKAKRRVTLSISGLGLLDESEIDEDRSPQYPAAGGAREPLRLHPSMSQEERTQLASSASEGAGRETTTVGAEQQGVDRVPAAALPSEAERANTEPCEISRGDEKPETWSTWATLLYGYVKAAPDADTINAWTTANATHLAALKQYDAGKHTKLIAMIDAQIAARNEQGS